VNRRPICARRYRFLDFLSYRLRQSVNAFDFFCTLSQCGARDFRSLLTFSRGDRGSTFFFHPVPLELPHHARPALFSSLADRACPSHRLLPLLPHEQTLLIVPCKDFFILSFCGASPIPWPFRTLNEGFNFPDFFPPPSPSVSPLVLLFFTPCLRASSL